MTTLTTNNRLDEIRYRWTSFESGATTDPQALKDVLCLLTLLNARPAVTGDARAIVEEFFPPDALPDAEWKLRLIDRITAHANQRYREGVIATLRHAIEVADGLEYELPQFQHMQGAEAVRKKLQAELDALLKESE